MNETDAEYRERRARKRELKRVVRRRVLVGYAGAASLFLVAMALFGYAIVTVNDRVGGLGGIVLTTSATMTIVTGVYHSMYYPLERED